MANATSVVVVKNGREQFQGVFDRVFEVRATIDADSLADGAGDNDTIAVPGVALGDMVLGISLGVDLAGMTVTGWVSAADVVTVRFQNESGTNPLNLAETTIKVLIGRPGW
jgi:hypothetical protein